MAAVAWLVALLLLGAAAVAIAVIVKASALKRRHRALLGAPLPLLQPGAEALVDAPRALYHGTRFADGALVLDPALGPPCVADLRCTAEAIFLRREAAGPAAAATIAIPLAWIEDAALVRGHAELAGKELPMLRLRWIRGGQALETSVSLRGGMAQLEKLRREVHLRQGHGSALAALQKFIEQQPEAPK